MRKPTNVAGLSLVELLVAVAIIMIISATGIPSILRSLRTYHLNSTAINVANIIQRTRFEAVRRNTIVPCRARPLGNTTVVWMDINSQVCSTWTAGAACAAPPAGWNNTITGNEPQFLLPTDVQFLAAGVAPGPASMGFAAAQVPAGVIAFDARGTANFGAGVPAIYVIYMGYPGQPAYGYRAVTLTPTGQTKVWSAPAGGAWHAQ